MNAITLKGWCPSLYQPMRAGDGLLVRVKPFDARLSAAAARGLADAASRHGNGIIELTQRGNLQIRGLSAGSLPEFTARMLALRLCAAAPAVERIRNLAVPALLGVDPGLAPATGGIAAALAAGLATDRRLAALPDKFGFALDGGGALPLAAPWADILLRATAGGWAVIAAGAAGAAAVAAGEAAEAALALARASLALGGGRVGELIAAGRGAALFAAAGLDNLAPPPPCPAPARPGPLRYGGATAVLAAPRFGQIDAGMLRDLAGIAARCADGALRLTTTRLFVLAGIAASGVVAASDALAAAGLIVDPADPALGIAACPGAPACPSGHRPARADAALLAAGWHGLPRLHVSGCAKGCAHPGPAALTLTARPDGYALIRNGRADDDAIATGLTAGAALQLIRAQAAA